MAVYIYPVYSTNSSSIDVVFCKIGSEVFVLRNREDLKAVESSLFNECIVFYGGHSVLSKIIRFGFSIKNSYIDLQHYFWNMDTNITNISLEESYCRYVLCSEDSDNVSSQIKSSCFNIRIKSYSLKPGLDCKMSVDCETYSDVVYIFNILEAMHKTISSSSMNFADFIDDKLCKSLVLLESTGTKLDFKYLAKIRTEINSKLSSILESIYFIVGKKFNINSQRELNYVLKEIGVMNNKVSKIELLSNYNQTGLLLFKYIDEYRKLTVCYEQYIKPLYESALKNSFGRFKYNACRVPCLTRGHFCFEKSRGIVDISEIKVSDYIWTEYGFKKVVRADNYLSKNLIKVDFSNGLSVTGTSHHPILINSCDSMSCNKSIEAKWCSLEHLFVGEKVICNYDYSSLCESEQYIEIGYRICSLFNKYVDDIQDEKEYLKLSDMKLSDTINFLKFKSFVEFLGLKCWCFRKSGDVYDVVFYHSSSLNYLLRNFSKFLTDRVKKLIKVVIENNCIFEKQSSVDGYFNGSYEETIVTGITSIKNEDIVYDIEVEDVHQYNSNGVVNHNTGRLSSLRSGGIDGNMFCNINIQSVPKQDMCGINIRKSFLPNNDCYWCCIDYKAQELRLVSCLYGIKYINDIALNDDVYERLIPLFKFFEESKISFENKRKCVKTLILGIVYGLSNLGISSQLKQYGFDDCGINFRDEIYSLMPELVEGQKRTLEYAHSVNGIYTLSGRFRKIEFSHWDYENFFTRNNRIALNTVVQGSCGDIIRNVVNRVEKTIYPEYSKSGFCLLSTIHDEINVSIPKDEKIFYEVLEKLKKIIELPFLDYKNLKFGYSVSVGENWGALRKLS